MDRLERLIHDNKNAIQSDEPLEGHFERFRLKIEKQQKRTIPITYKIAPAIAAVLIIALLIANLFQNKQDKIEANSFYTENYNMKLFYTSNINNGVHRIEELLEKNNPEVLNDLQNELVVFDTIHKQICADLEASPNNERVTNALIVYYQTKLALIEQILHQIENKQKIEYHETDINI